MAAHNDYIRAALTILILAGCGLLIWQANTAPPEVRPDVSQVWIVVALVVGWWFGSSAGSARKQDTLDRIAEAPTLTIPTEGDTTVTTNAPGLQEGGTATVNTDTPT